MAGFSVNIGANASQLTGTIAQVKKDLSGLKFPANFGRLPLQDINSLKGAVSQFKNEISSGFIPSVNNIAPAVNKAGESIRNLRPGASQATSALTNLGRVASDAPFGFIAISNNLDPLIQSFVYLKRETGSTSGALKALGSSLLGGGGVALAFSIVTSALTFFSLSARGANNEVKSLNDVIRESNKQVGEEIARIKILTTVAGDHTRSIDERKSAASEFQKVLKGYNIQLSQEAILNGQVSEATKLATTAILERAKARAIEGKIAENEQKKLDLLISRGNLFREIQRLEKIGDAGSKGLAASFREDIKRIDQQFLDLGQNTQELIARIRNEDITPSFDTEKTKKDTDILKQRIDVLKTLQDLTGLTRKQKIELTDLEVRLATRDAVKLGFTNEELQQQIEGILERAFPIKTFEFNIKAALNIEIDKTAPVLNVAEAIGAAQIDEGAFDGVINKIKQNATNKLAALNSEIAQGIISSTANSIQGALIESANLLGESIADIFSGGDFGSALAKFGEGVLSIIGGVIQTIGKEIIAASTLVETLKKVLGAVGFGAASLGIGVALVALGGVLKNVKFGQGTKFAEGGIVTGPTRGVFGEAGPEAVIPLSRLPQIIGQANQSSSGGGAFTATIVDGGRDLILLMERAQRTFDRNF